MPSLSALEKFKASFNDIGDQKANLEAQDIHFEDLKLPDSEPEPMDGKTPAPGEDAETNASADVSGEDVSPDNFDVSQFSNPLSDDLPDQSSLDADFPDDTQAEQGAGDFYPPEELLSNLPEELEAIPPESTPLDLDSLDNFDFPEEPIPPRRSKSPDSGILDINDPLSSDLSADFDSDVFGDLGIPDEPVAEEPIAKEPIPDEPIVDEPSKVEDIPNLDVPGDLGIPDEPVVDEPVAAETGADFDLDGLGDFDFPEELAPAPEDSGESLDLDGLGDLDFPEEPAPAPEDSGGSLDLDGLGDLDFPEEPAPAPEDSGGSLDLDGLGDFDFSEEPAPAPEDSGSSLDLDGLGDFDFSEEPASAPEDSGESLDLDGLGDLDSPEEPAPAPEDSGEGLDPDVLGDFDFPEESASTDTMGGGVDLGDMDDLIAPNEDVSVNDDGSIDAGEPITPAGSDGMDDFVFHDLDAVLSGSKAKPEKAKDTGKKGKGKAQPIPSDIESDEVEEILLSEEDFQGLQETLARYPLNLRLACEEIIAEHAVNPKQMSELIEHLVWGASARETALLASRILGRTIDVPKGFEKSTGEALEAEKQSFAYIFIHSFLPVLRLFMFIAVVAASLFYLMYVFLYIPSKAESLYRIGYERIFAGEYQRANERFTEAFTIHRKKDWFYRYAEAFRDERQFIYAEQKYDELLRYYPRDKKGVLDYAYMQTYYLRNYAKADALLRHQLLDYASNDREGLLAAGDNNLIWGEIDPSRYENARYMYARVLEKYGWRGPYVERMLKYFIRVDDLGEVLHLRGWFENNPRWELSGEMLGELGGYLLDKQLEEVRGVPNEYVEHIDGVRDLLLKAVYADPMLPEPHYHLARYHHSLGNTHEEQRTLHQAIRAFDLAHEETVRRRQYRIDAHQRYADSLISTREFIPAEEQLVRGINLYEDAVTRRLISRSPQYGRLYAGLGDLAYFTKIGDMEAALRYYSRSEQNGWAPPEMQYRMGAAYYQLEDWGNALEYLFSASSTLPLNHRILYAMGNAALRRGNYFAALGYYNRLLDLLEGQRSRLPVLLPNDRPEFLELAERLMMARNNAGVACEMLAAQTGDRSYQTRALAFYAEAQRAWDARTRDPRSMLRPGSTPLPHLNARNALYPQMNYEPQIFIRIDNEALDPSPWEALAPLSRLDHGRPN